MANIRRGTAADCARAAAGVIASRSGSARPTPTPRSIVRREIAFVFDMVALPIGVYFGRDRSQRSPEQCRGLHIRSRGYYRDLLRRFAIREADGRAGSVGGKLADEVPSYRSLFMIEQEPFEFANVFEGAAIGEDGRRIHGQPVVESEWLSRKADTGLGFTFSAKARYRSRQPPITSKLSSANPGGSIFRWHEAQLGSAR